MFSVFNKTLIVGTVWLACVAYAGIGHPATQAAEALPAPDDTITVLLQSGRSFRGSIDQETDDRLWLRTDRQGISWRRPVDWTAVVSATRGEQTLTRDDLRTLAEELKTPRTRSEYPPETGDGASDWTWDQHLPVAASVPAVQSIAIDCYVGQWDADVALDGLVVQVVPLDAAGNVVAVSGTLNVELYGTRGGAVTLREHAPRLGRWSRPIHAENVGPNGVSVRLGFQAIRPEFQRDLGTHGLVVAQLVVPGQGTFMASSDMVRLWPYSSVRDRYLLYRGDRFLPVERAVR